MKIGVNFGYNSSTTNYPPYIFKNILIKINCTCLTTIVVSLPTETFRAELSPPRLTRGLLGLLLTSCGIF